MGSAAPWIVNIILTFHVGWIVIVSCESRAYLMYPVVPSDMDDCIQTASIAQQHCWSLFHACWFHIHLQSNDATCLFCNIDSLDNVSPSYSDISGNVALMSHEQSHHQAICNDQHSGIRHGYGHSRNMFQWNMMTMVQVSNKWAINEPLSWQKR